MRTGFVVAIALLVVSAAVMPGCSGTAEILTTKLPDGTLNVAYDFQIEAKGAGDDWSLAQGSLPPGIGLNSHGRLSGTPTKTGAFSFTVQVVKFTYGTTDPSRSASQGLTLTVR